MMYTQNNNFKLLNIISYIISVSVIFNIFIFNIIQKNNI